MKQQLYMKLWRTIAMTCKLRSKNFVSIHIFAALRLSSWATLRDPKFSTVVDGHERLLRAIIMDDSKDHSTREHLEKQFYRVLHETPHAPIQALCMLYMLYPKLSFLLGLSHKELQHAINNNSKLVNDVVPHTWQTSEEVRDQHFISLIRSIEIWLTAFYKISIPIKK